MYGSDAGQPVPSLYTKGLSPLCDKDRTSQTTYENSVALFHYIQLYAVCERASLSNQHQDSVLADPSVFIPSFAELNLIVPFALYVHMQLLVSMIVVDVK